MNYFRRFLCWIGWHVDVQTIYDNEGMLRWCGFCGKFLDQDY